MKMALRRLQPRYADRLVVAASYWDLCADRWAELARGPRKSMGHACEFETAMMMHLRPDLVRADRRADDHLDRSDRLRSLFWAEDFSQATIQGAVGFPTHATAESGREYLAAATERCVETCQELLSVQQPPGRVRKGWQV